MDTGWIKLHRNLIDWEWWDDHNASRLLIYLLCKVNYEEKKWKGIKIPKGGLVCSYETLAFGTGLSVKQIRTAMKKLEDSGEVTRKRADKGQLVTLVKWEKMQSTDGQEGRQMGTLRAVRGQEEGRQRATTKEYKERKERKEYTAQDFQSRKWTPKDEIPDLEEWLDYAYWKYPNKKQSHWESKYHACISNDWKDGNDKKIKSWQGKIHGFSNYIEDQKPTQSEPVPPYLKNRL